MVGVCVCGWVYVYVGGSGGGDEGLMVGDWSDRIRSFKWDE